MNERTLQVLKSFGILPEQVPPGSVSLLNETQLKSLGKRVNDWVRKGPQNHEALAYAIDTEHKSPVGLALRNLEKGVKKDHLLITSGDGPFWHNLHNALPFIYRKSFAILVEGPKDARVFSAYIAPAVAVLGSVPSYNHLRIIHRYARYVLWVGDRPLGTPEEEFRLQKVRKHAEDLGLKFLELTLPCKDPADLVFNPSHMQTIKEKVGEYLNLLA